MNPRKKTGGARLYDGPQTTPEEQDAPRLPEVAPETVDGPRVREGDIYKHYVEEQWMLIVQISDGTLFFVREKGHAPTMICNTAYTMLLKHKQEMSEDNANLLVAEGSWLFRENIQRLWK